MANLAVSSVPGVQASDWPETLAPTAPPGPGVGMVEKESPLQPVLPWSTASEPVFASTGLRSRRTLARGPGAWLKSPALPSATEVRPHRRHAGFDEWGLCYFNLVWRRRGARRRRR